MSHICRPKYDLAGNSFHLLLVANGEQCTPLVAITDKRLNNYTLESNLPGNGSNYIDEKARSSQR
jgi:hypothetical protein